MRIAHIISTFPPYRGGMGNSVLHSVKELGRFGHSNTVFTPAYTKIVEEDAASANVKVVRLRPLIAIGNAAILPQLLWRLKEFDIIHLHYPFFGTADIVVLGKLLRLFSGKLIIHYHMDTVSQGAKGFIFSIYKFFFLPVIARLASMITCASLDYIRHSDLGAFYETHHQKFCEVSFGVDADRFCPAPAAKRPHVLFVGGLDRQHYFKGVERLIEIFPLVRQAVPPARLVLVGRGDLENYYRELAAKAGIADALDMVTDATDEDLIGYYCEAMVTVLPSINKSEAFGLVLLESMSCGTPVIASNLPGVRNVFRNSQHGFLIRTDDNTDLANRLIAMMTHPEETMAMGRAARAWVEENYSWQRSAQKLEVAYLRLLYTPAQTAV